MTSKHEKKHEGLDRYIILALFIIVAAAAIIYNLAKIQLVDGQNYREEAIYRLSSTGVIYPKRGDILTETGFPLPEAVWATVPSMWMSRCPMMKKTGCS